MIFADATSRPLRLRFVVTAAALYSLCLVAFNSAGLVVQAMPEDWPRIKALLVVHLLLGFLLSRLVLRRLVEWHPMTSTLRGVTNYKLWCLLFWPLAYPLLLLRMFINWLL